MSSSRFVDVFFFFEGRDDNNIQIEENGPYSSVKYTCPHRIRAVFFTLRLSFNLRFFNCYFTGFSLGYFEQALQLSAKYRRHEKFVKIQIENLKQFQSALDYIEKLKFDDAIEVFRTYGKTLMKEEPKGTTQLLKQLKPTPQEISEENLPESLINLFINHPDELLEYLDFAVNVNVSLILLLIT